MREPLLTFTQSGIYCRQADVYLDPWLPVSKAVISHAHSDHARPGNGSYLAHTDSETILRLRLGAINLETRGYNEPVNINGVTISFHPAGHIIGSAQIRLEYRGEVWTFSGDYKLENDGLAAPFEPVKSNVFITESTFGLPVYKWQPQEMIYEDMRSWWRENRMNDKSTVLMGYALGKMQRIIRAMQPFEGNVYAHGAIFNVNEQLRNAGFDLPFIPPVSQVSDKALFRGALILAPSSALNSAWMRKFEPYVTGYCSGWMTVRGAKNRRAIDKGFALSDHADWNDLNIAVAETGAEKVFVTHGYTGAFSRWLNEKGIEAGEVKTAYGETDDADLVTEAEKG